MLPLLLSVLLTLASAAACALATITEWHGFSELQHRHFLEKFWQRRPLLIRSLLNTDELEEFCALRPHEVLEFATEPGALARLVQESGGERCPWQLSQPPFEAAQLARLEDWRERLAAIDEAGDSIDAEPEPWTVLVQEVDQLCPEVEALRERFNFVPRWRVDDVMVSYAPPGGSVGAHVDSYDVFLLQGLGARRWSIEGTPRAAADEKLLRGPEVRVLERFDEANAWTLQPGDALYLPPRWAHHGVSCDPCCLTYSIGFRAPSVPELLGSFSRHLAATAPAQAHFEAPPLSSLLSAEMQRGLIDEASIAHAREAIRSVFEATLGDERAFAAWLGCELTKPRRRAAAAAAGWADIGAELSEGGEFQVLEAIASGEEGAPSLRHAESAIFAFIEHSRDGGVSFFIDGEEVPVPPAAELFVPLLCQSSRLPPELLQEPLRKSPPFRELVARLLRLDELYEELLP